MALAERGGSIAVYVVMKVSVSWCTTAGLGVATWFPSGQFFPRSPHVGNMFAKLGLLPAAEATAGCWRC